MKFVLKFYKKKVLRLKVLFFVSLLTTFLFSEVYYSKVQPYELRDIGSSVSGLVLDIDEDLLGKKLGSEVYIKIDDELDKKELNLLNKKIEFIQKKIITNEKILKNVESSLVKKRKNYDRIKSLKIKSSVEKDREFYDLINSENLFLNTQKDILNLKVQISDYELRKAQLKKSINDKSLINKGFVLYSIKVKVGQVVSPSMLLAQVADISKAKLTIYLDRTDLENLTDKIVYIDGKKTDYKLTRVVKIADVTNISKYKAEIIIKSPKVFSNLVKVELK